jgi:hypothetical protein
VKKRKKQGIQVPGDELRALCRGVDSVFLNRIRDVVNMRIEHGQERHMIFGRDFRKNRIKLPDIVRAVVWGQCDPGKQHFAARLMERSNNRIQVRFRCSQGKTAQAIVPSQLNNHNCGMQCEHAAQPVNSVLGSVPADTLVNHPVMVAAGAQFGLQVVWITVARFQAVAGGNAVSKTDDGGTRALRGSVRLHNSEREDGQQDEATPEIHRFSVAMG